MLIREIDKFLLGDLFHPVELSDVIFPLDAVFESVYEGVAAVIIGFKSFYSIKL